MSESIGQIFTDLEQEAAAKIKQLETEGVEWIRKEAPIAADFLGTVFKQLLSIALSAAFAEAPKLISGHEKFSNAVVNTYQTAVGQGMLVLIQDVQAAVQTGYYTMKKALSQ